jgi:SAM-dependent methyltransferase
LLLLESTKAAYLGGMAPFFRTLLARIVQRAPFQPATNFWRAIELTFLIEKGLPHLAACQSLFDLGCGDGEIMRLLRDHLPPHISVTGMDIDPAEIELARASGVYARLLCGSAAVVPLPNESQDGILSNSVLEHVAPIEGTLREAGRLLKKGGWFVATVPAPGFHDCLKGSWRRGVSHKAYCEEMDKRLVHYRYWSCDEWQDQLGRAGIKLVVCLPYLNQSETRRWEFLSRITGGLLYHLGKGRQRPIHIQRQLGVRRSMCLPFWLARWMAALIAWGVREEGASHKHACFLVIGQKA